MDGIETGRRLVRQLVADLADLLLPRWCLGCYQLGEWWCSGCQQQASLLPLGWCGSCDRRAPDGTTLCRRCCEPLRITKLVSAVVYAGPAERLIRAVKYRPARVGLAAIVTAPVQHQLLGAIPDHAQLVPIPMQPKRLLARGFNQAAVLAQLLARPGQAVRPELVRQRPVHPQVGLERTARLENMANVFTWTGPRLTGETVCLVDDVLTTGATLTDAARALRKAGARRVVAITLAQTPRDHNRLARSQMPPRFS